MISISCVCWVGQGERKVVVVVVVVVHNLSVINLYDDGGVWV